MHIFFVLLCSFASAGGRPNIFILGIDDNETTRNEFDVCELQKVSGMCRGYNPRFFFDQKTGSCQLFIYGGCGGNANNFQTKTECNDACTKDDNSIQSDGSGDDVIATINTLNLPEHCKLPVVSGPCEAMFKKYYFNHETGTCHRFYYGGCMGNMNKFETLGECEKSCLHGMTDHLEDQSGSGLIIPKYLLTIIKNKV